MWKLICVCGPENFGNEQLQKGKKKQEFRLFKHYKCEECSFTICVMVKLFQTPAPDLGESFVPTLQSQKHLKAKLFLIGWTILTKTTDY